MTSELADGSSRSFAFGAFVLIPARQLLLDNQVPVRIGGRALDILTALVEQPGELVSKDELIARVWPDTSVEEGNLKVNMAALRRVLGEEPGGNQYIATVVGRGYRFVAPVLSFVGDAPPLEAGALGAVRSHNLPTGTTAIFGRANAIEAIRRDLHESRLVSIVGAGGIGKTTVAFAVAEHAVGLFRDGVWLVDLGLQRDPAWVPNAIATAIGSALNSADMLSELIAFLGDRELLLVFDNCEHIIHGAAICVDRILRQTSGVKFLATTREPLRVKAERVHRLPALGVPPPSSCPSAAEALTFPAIQLFVDRASNSFESFELSDVDAPTVAEICRRLDCLPLAIEFAATRVEAFGVDGLLKQLDDRFRLLVGRRGGPERHRTLMATLDWSYSLLSSEAALLRAVSVFAGVFEIDGAAAVSNLAPIETTDGLAQLAAKSLLAPDLDADGIAYRLLETTRTYCLERLQMSGEEQAVRSRHAQHVCTVLERAASEWEHRPANEWGPAYARVLDDLRAALAWAGQDPANRTLRIRLTVAGLPLWNHFSLTEECRVHAAQAVEELDGTDLAGTAGEMQLQLSLAGATLFTRGPSQQVMKALRRALDIAIQTGTSDCRLRCLRMIASYELFSGEHDAGIRTLESFVSVAAAEDPTAVPEGESHLGLGELLVGRLHTARQRLERLYEHDLQDFNDSRFVRFLYARNVDVGNVLSNAQWLTGSPDTAARTAGATVEHALKTKHALSLSNALVFAIPILFWNGHYPLSARYVGMLDDQVMRHGIVTWRPLALFYRGALACAQNDSSEQGIDDLQRAIVELRAINHRVRLPYYLGVLAEALARRAHWGDAETTMRAALEHAGAQNEQWCMPELLRIQAFMLTARGQADEATPVLLESMALAQQIGAQSWRLRAASDLAQLWRAQSRALEARELLLPIYAQFSEGFATRDLRIARDLLASLQDSKQA